MPVSTNLSWHQAEDLTLTFTASTTTSISGWTFALYLLDEDGVVLATKTDFTITSSANGVLTFPLTSAESAAYPTAKFFQLRRVDSGHNTVLALGPVTVLK